MRILGFSQKWLKLSLPTFTTFRLPRKDKDWFTGEDVQIVFLPRSKKRKILGIGTILSVETMVFDRITELEAFLDGFENQRDMLRWLSKTHHGFTNTSLINKITVGYRRRIET
jgi:hypothetical protein